MGLSPTDSFQCSTPTARRGEFLSQGTAILLVRTGLRRPDQALRVSPVTMSHGAEERA